MEVRKEIKWYGWKYFVSNMGNVKSRFRILIPETNRWWRKLVHLYNWWRHTRKHFQVHRLVYCTFNNIDLKFTGDNLICHKDDDPSNNMLDNLFLWTPKDNTQDAILKWRLCKIGDIIKDRWLAPWNKWKKMPLWLIQKRSKSIRKRYNKQCKEAYEFRKETNLTHKEIAELFWVCRRTIYQRIKDYKNHCLT